jgi:putative flippase GtrA
LQLGRFLTAAAVAFGINTFWIWLTTKQLGLPPLAPVPLMMAATPILSFLLNRYWVFKAH